MGSIAVHMKLKKLMRLSLVTYPFGQILFLVHIKLWGEEARFELFAVKEELVHVDDVVLRDALLVEATVRELVVLDAVEHVRVKQLAKVVSLFYEWDKLLLL